MYSSHWNFRGAPSWFRGAPPLQASKTHLDVHERGLEGISGANHVISQLQAQPTIQHLVIGNNALGDDGTAKLFDYLRGPGRIHQLVEISLNSCHIGNLGLRAIAAYVDGNSALEMLLLQNNLFNPSWGLCSAFTSALNNSHIAVLSLTSNPQLSDTFLFRFLPNLQSPYLRVLQLSAMGLTSISTPHLISFISADNPSSLPKGPSLFERKSTRIQTRLYDLRLNGNAFTLPCANTIVNALQRSNFSLRHLEMHANKFDPFPLDEAFDETTEESPNPPLLLWPDLTKQMQLIFSRNHLLTTQTERASRRLLMASRSLLLPPSISTPSSSPWRLIPVELQHYILSLLYPGLSPQQQIKVWKFASDRETLPSATAGLAPLFWRDPMIKSREEMLSDWLKQVDCDRFEWYFGWEDDFAGRSSS